MLDALQLGKIGAVEEVDLSHWSPIVVTTPLI